MNIEEIKYRVNKTKNAFHKLGIEGQVNINLMLNDIEFLLTAYEKEKEIVDKINKLNIPVDTLIAEFERLENLEDDRDMLKSELEKEKEKNKLLEENYSSAHEDINWFCENYISKEVSEQKERKAYIKGTNDAHELCNKKWEDKIKAKIEEIDEVLKGQLIEKIRIYFEAQKEVLQSLLEKE